MTTIGRRSSKEVEGLAPYLRAIHDFPALSRHDEHVLAIRVRDGDPEAKKELALHNLAFVVSIAQRQRRGALGLDDLVQEGNVGLMRAIDMFDPHAGTRLSTYAVWWIRAYMGKHLKEARSSVRPQNGTVAQVDLSLDSTIDEEGAAPLDLVEDARPGPEDAYLTCEGDRDVREALRKVRKRIGELGWDIVHDRLEREQPRNLEEIGKRWGVSREHVRQVELKTKQFLRAYLAPVDCAA